mmetsp:Transcript_2248/g.6714  ORF Transcript_2248/g.6714 Transcript_2248/m.6714 type:complete len:573 (+) Transcript_2248:133-1851(+)
MAAAQSWVQDLQRSVQDAVKAMEGARKPSMRTSQANSLNMNVIKKFAAGEIELAQMESGGGVTGLVNAVKVHKDSDAVVGKCAAALQIYVLGGGTSKQRAFLKSNAIPYFVNSIRESTNPSDALAVLNLLLMFTTTKSAVSRMQDSSAVDHVLRMLSAKPDSGATVSAALMFLCNVCVGHKASKLELQKKKGIEAVVACMELYSTDVKVQQSSALLMRTLASECEETKNDIALHGTGPLLTVMSKSSGEKDAVHQACNALINVTSKSLKNRSLIQVNNGLPVLTHILTVWRTNKDICADALALLRNTINGDENAPKFVSDIDGCINAVCEAMIENDDSHEVQLRGAQVLRYAMFAEENRALLQAGRGVLAIAGAIRYATDHKTIGEEFYIDVLLALGNACFNNQENKTRAGKVGALGFAVKLLFGHRDMLNVQEAGLRLLRCLTEDNEFNARLAASHKCLSLCTMDLVGHADSADICENGFALLLNLCYCREMLERMLEADVENIVITTLEEKHPNNRIVQIQGQRFLLVLQTEPQEVTDNPSQIANRYEDYIDEVVLPTRSSGSLKRALCG